MLHRSDNIIIYVLRTYHFKLIKIFSSSKQRQCESITLMVLEFLLSDSIRHLKLHINDADSFILSVKCYKECLHVAGLLKRVWRAIILMLYFHSLSEKEIYKHGQFLLFSSARENSYKIYFYLISSVGLIW